MSALELVGVQVRLGGRPALEGASLAVRAGELVALCGPNGAGKSTALRALAGLLPLQVGSARLGGMDVGRLSPPERATRLAYLAQDRSVAWNLRARDVAALGVPPGAEDRVERALSDLGMAEHAGRGVNDLSGGERARVLIARALAQPAEALLADEPTAGLDPDGRLQVMELLRDRARAGQAVLVSLHDLDLAARFADRLVVLHRGRVRAEGAPEAALSLRKLQLSSRVQAAVYAAGRELG